VTKPPENLAELLEHVTKQCRKQKIINRAKQMYHREGEIEIDDNARLSEGDDDGCYVQAWVWVPNEETKP